MGYYDTSRIPQKAITKQELIPKWLNSESNILKENTCKQCLVFVLLPVLELLIFPFDASFEYGALKFAKLPSVSHRLLTKAIIIALKDFL